MGLNNKEKRLSYVFIFCILTASIITGGYLYYLNIKKQHRALMERYLSTIAELKKSELVNWRKERLGDAGCLFKNTAFSSLVQRFFENPEDSEAQGQIRGWIDLLRVNFKYDRIRLLDGKGVVRMSSPENLGLVTPLILQHASETLRSGLVTFVDFYRNHYDQRIYLSVIVPILDEKNGNRAIGTLLLRIDAEKFLYPFISRWPTPSNSAETLLVRRDGKYVLFLNELRYQKNSALRLRIPLESKYVPAVKAVLGQEGIVEGIDYRNVPVVASVCVIPDSPWFLIARMDTSEVDEPLKERLWRTVTFFCVIIISLGLGLGFIWRSHSMRFYQEKAEAGTKLLESEGRFRAILNATPAVVFLLDREFRIVEMNMALSGSLHKTREQLLGRDVFDLLPPDVAAQRKAYIEGVFRTGEPFRIETEREGRWHDAVHSPIRDTAGDVVGVAVIALDITERKGAERALRESEERLSLVLEGSQLGFWDWDIRTGEVRRNDRWAEMLGYTLKEIELTVPQWTDLLHPDDRAVAWQHIQDHLEGRTTVYRNEYRMLTKDGKWKWILDQAKIVEHDSYGQALRMCGTHADITERKLMEQALRNSERTISTLLNVADESIWLFDLEGYILTANNTAARRLGKRVDEIVGIKWEDLVSPHLRESRWKIIEEVVRTLAPVYFDEEREGVIFAHKFIPVWYEGGKLAAVATFSRDITESKKVEEGIKKSLKEKEVLLRELYHRTKNNMQVIISLINLQSDRIEDEKVLETFKDTTGRIKSMALVHQKLYQSKNLSRIDLKDYIEDLAGMIMKGQNKRPRAIALKMDMESVFVSIDYAVPCGLIINELIANALKHAFPGEGDGEIRVILRRKADGEIEIGVEDNGMGLEEGLDIRQCKSLGLELVVQLTEHQLLGQLEVRNEKGTQSWIRFKDTGYKNRM